MFDLFDNNSSGARGRKGENHLQRKIDAKLLTSASKSAEEALVHQAKEGSMFRPHLTLNGKAPNGTNKRKSKADPVHGTPTGTRVCSMRLPSGALASVFWNPIYRSRYF